ncbi:hypothetical protein OJF2_23410 [Aquisphaera giovannonii]|uniref:DUF4340 domain-containing protein n=1 Tax=Aquisphaera giovannonii TaxID=406548 RepID=A0A5B9W0P7_9BACT|nr:hypothetical protein [Aquisphaera giovannonii]QEH33811.1 hypothetical protein OJF2_23410 [Aquisphaera giovannonii]
MTERRGGHRPSGTWARGLIVLLAASGACGCLGPKAVKLSRIRYNEAYRDTNDEQLLLNIVRLRYADSPVFIDLPNITSQFEVAGSGNYQGGYGFQFPGHVNLGTGTLSARDTPTLSYHPREGREIARALLTPLTADFFSLVTIGANTEQILMLTINDFNDVRNAPQATVLHPRTPDENARFRQGAHLLASLIERDAAELLIGTTEEDEDSSEPVPAGSIRGSDLLNAAKDGYVFRARGGDRVTLVKRERGLVLKVRPQYVNSPEMLALAEVFRFRPGRRIYRIKSELTADATTRMPGPLGDESDTIYLNLRSVLQVLTFLSKGVCVPAEHVENGIAPSTPGPDGRPFDWTGITRGFFFVHSDRHRPKHAEVEVSYRGYWFYIAPNDVASRASLAILEMLFALEESEEKPGGPLLTLPVSGGG